MPIYTFSCTKCPHNIEKILKMSELDQFKSTGTCDKCNAPISQTILTAPALNIPFHMRTAYQWEGYNKGKEAGKYHGVDIITGKPL